MAITRKVDGQPPRTTLDEQKSQRLPINRKDVQKTIRPIVDELTPVQRKQLDAAVMMLVNYLLSAYSDKSTCLPRE
jgi:hypothetical protein